MTHQTSSASRERLRNAAAFLLGLTVTAIGVLHFVTPDFFVKIVPRELPRPDLLVALSGVAEVGLGLALCVPRLRRHARWGLVALFVAVFPANINMLVRHAEVAPELPLWALVARLPFQFLFIAWAIWAGAKPTAEPPPRAGQ